MLGSVTRPDGKVVTFKYDAQGRRIEKTFNGRVHRYLWDGDVVLHEWEYDETERPQQIVAENGDVSFDRPEPTENLVTWVYDTDSYVPTAKLVNGKRYGIVSDYIGRPVQAYDEHGTLAWQADYDIYGNLFNLRGNRGFVPFRQLGQYEDEETGLYYNRFRYYDPSTGGYISQDPIELAGNNPTLYGFVYDINTQFDVFATDIFDIIPYSQKATGFEKHHGVMDAWATANIPDYRKLDAPTIVLTPTQHNATRSEFMKWKKEKFGTTKGKIDWSKVSAREAQSLSERLLNKAGVPMEIRSKYYRAFNQYNYEGKFKCN